MKTSKLFLSFTLLMLMMLSVGCTTSDAQTSTPNDKLSQNTPKPKLQENVKITVDKTTAEPPTQNNLFEAPELDGAEWRLVFLNGKAVNVDITLTFTANEIKGSSGCNLYFGQYQLNGNRLTITGLGGTEMYCDDPAMQQEVEYLQTLESAQSVESTSNQLTIITNNGALVFEPILPVADKSLESTSWHLFTFESGEVASSLLVDTFITLEFTGNEVSGSSGCNSYFGNYQLNGNRLTITGLGGTEMYCDDPIMQQEVGYLQALESAQSVNIEGDILRITHTNGTLVFTTDQ